MALEGVGFKADMDMVVEETYGTLDTSAPTITAYPFISETLTETPNYFENDSKEGGDEAAKAPTLDRLNSPSGVITSYFDYHNFNMLLSQAIGIVNTGVGSVADPFVFEPDASISLSKSIVIDKVKERWQYTGGIIKRITLSGSAGDDGRIKLETEWLFQKLTLSDTPISATSATASEYMKMSQLVFRIGDQADALAAGDALAITDFTLTWNNNWLEKYASGSAYMMQPTIRDIPREVTLAFTAARYNSDAEITAIQTAIRAGTKLQADLTFTGGTSPRSFLIQIPELMKCTAYPNAPVDGPGNLTFSTTLQAHKNSHATIMSTVDYEALFTLTITS